MKTAVTLFSILAISQAASIIPIDTSVVNVKTEHSGQDYSYSIHENHGFAINPSETIHPGVPIIRKIPQIPTGTNFIPVPEHGVHLKDHLQEQLQDAKPQSVKTAPEHDGAAHGIPVATIPATYYLNYVPLYYPYSGIPYYPHNLLYKIA